MDGIESKLQQIMSDPNMMQQIMSIAQNFQTQPQEEAPPPPMPDIDMATISRIAGFANQSNIDQNQRNLLSALAPYLSQYRISKLERAMRAAKLANVAGNFLSQSNGR